ERIISGDASPILITSKSSTAFCCLKSFSRSFIQFTYRKYLVAKSVAGRTRSARLIELDVDAERANLLDQHVERLRHSGLHLVRTVDDVLVHPRSPLNVVGLDGQHLLQGICRAVRLERPDLHLAETLPAELRLAAQRLLRDQAVRPGRERVHLVVDQ